MNNFNAYIRRKFAPKAKIENPVLAQARINDGIINLIEHTMRQISNLQDRIEKLEEKING